MDLKFILLIYFCYGQVQLCRDFAISAADMKARALTVHWHEEQQPIYSADFQRAGDVIPDGCTARLATAGGDDNVRLWRLGPPAVPGGAPTVEIRATLSRHTQAVNVVRFSPATPVLASAGDDGTVLFWEQTERATTSEDEDVESWRVRIATRSIGAEIYDLAWSPKGDYIAAACMDNIVRIYEVDTARCVRQLTDHGHYVQGVAWDPSNRYLASQSSDRTVYVYNTGRGNGLLRITKSELPPCSSVNADESHGDEDKDAGAGESQPRLALFHNEAFPSFFRRLAFSPDGRLLVTPAGVIRQGSTERNAVYIFGRASMGSLLAVLPCPKQTIGVQFSPKFYKRAATTNALFDLPYRMVFAVALIDGVFIYDTEHDAPLAVASNLHYSSYTDLAWTPDGTQLIATSSDGYCSMITFENELGDLFDGRVEMPAPLEGKKRGILDIVQESTRTAVAPTHEDQSKITGHPPQKPPSEQHAKRKRVAPTLVSPFPPA